MAPRVRTLALVLLSCALLLAFPIRVAGQSGSVYVVKSAVADMHSAPSEDSDVVSQAILASELKLLEVKGDWARVQTEDDYTGWTPLDDLVLKRASKQEKVAQVSALFARVYREPDVTAHQPIIVAPFESRLIVIDEMATDGDRWLKVRLPNDSFGYVQRGDIDFDPKPLSIPQSIELAKRFIGLPYTWGGRSSYGYDCSGFMQMLVRSRGIIMPRDAGPQAAWTGLRVIERGELQPGDLLYFGAPDKITHTGMYIGNGEFIHSTTHDHPVVQISRLDDQPWTRLLVACRRVK